MRVHLINPSHVSFGVAVITPRWLYVLAAATGTEWGDPHLVDETIDPVGSSRHQSGRRRRHRHPYRQCAARLRSWPNRTRAWRLGRVRRHPCHAVSGRSPRARRRPCGGQGRRRHHVGRGRPRLRRGPAGNGVRRRTRDGRELRVGPLGSAARGRLHVGVGADGPRLPEALLVLFGVANRRPGAALAYCSSRSFARWSSSGAAASGSSPSPTTISIR